MLVVGTVRTGEQHVDEELLTELSLEPVAAVVRPAALSPEATADLVGCGWAGRSPRCSPGLPPHHVGQPAAAPAAAARSGGRRGPARRGARRRRRRGRDRGPSRAWCSCGCAGCPSRRPTWPGRPPSSGTAPRCRWSPRSPSSPRRRPPPGSPRSPAARSSRTSSRWPSCTRWCGTPSTATCPRPSARCATSGRRRCWDRRGARRAGGRPPAAGARPRRPGDGRGAAPGRRTAADRGASDSAVTLLRRALAELPAGSCGATSSPSSA